MMNPLIKSCVQCGLLVLLTTLGGCGREAAEPSVVAPPEKSEAVDIGAASGESPPSAPLGESQRADSTSPMEAPGQLELPAGEIPEASDSAAPPSGSGGLEMPADVDVIPFVKQL